MLAGLRLSHGISLILLAALLVGLTPASTKAHPAFWAPFVLVGEGGASR
jgi:CHAT domain-containing protein